MGTDHHLPIEGHDCLRSPAPAVSFVQPIQYEAPARMKVMGALTLETVPGLNLQRLKALTAASSSMELPVLCVTEASVTLPLPESTSMTITALPVILFTRASYG